jgi:ATP-dependent Lon protease
VSKTTRKKPRATRKPKPQAPEAPPLPEIQGPEVFGLDATLHEAIPEQLPILPVRGVVMFPGTVMPLGVGRAASRRMLEENLPASKVIGIVTQRDEDDEAPGPADVYPVGTAALVLKLVRQPDDTLSLIVHGLGRIRLTDFVQTQPYMRANVEPMHEEFEQGKVSEAAVKNLRETAIELIDMTPNAPEQAQTVVMNIDGAGQLADFLAANLNLEVPEKQDLLEEADVVKRIRVVQLAISRQLEIARLQQKINDDVQSTITDGQRRFYLREQMRAIQKELGDADDGVAEQVSELRRKLEEAAPPEAVMTEAERELKRLDVIPQASPEYSVILTYLETVAELPWNHLSEDHLDLARAQKILDRDHHDLERVKRRLIEYLAVRKLNPEGRGPILCLVGPPGVGKTSLGQSIADALGRRFSRMSFGGIRDEAEIRGHRRTYIGSMPGRIIQEMRRAGTRNPVMMLDEIDKLGADFRGDPASALLEVLDPRQNGAFVDRYLDVPFDLSQVLFIATANYMDPVPPALRDRMEVIEIPGYTDEDKLQIARRYLVPRQLKENGLTTKHCRWTVAALKLIIASYTRESGVRELERQIGSVCRFVASHVARGKYRKPRSVTEELVTESLGPKQYVRDTALKTARPGVATGLAYTPVGGEVLFIEAAQYPGKGNVQLTGHIGDVMKESVHAAFTLVKTRAEALGIDGEAFAKADVHVHVPAGAVPKDGPSAGVAMFTALASLFMGKPVRGDVAMTGEITLRGLVLPIGGLKEKTLAAMRAGIKTVIVPALNRKDLPDLPPLVRKKLKFRFVENVDEVLAAAMGKRG